MAFLDNLNSGTLFTVSLVLLAISAVISLVCIFTKSEAIMNVITLILTLAGIGCLFLTRNASAFEMVNASSYDSDFSTYEISTETGTEVEETLSVYISADNPSLQLTNANEMYYSKTEIKDESGNEIFSQDDITAPGESLDVPIYDQLTMGEHTLSITTYYYESDALESAMISQEYNTVIVNVE